MRRVVSLPEPLDLRLVCGVHRRGPGDRALKVAEAEMVRATRTPEGPAALAVRIVAGRAECEAWGPGAPWALEQAPALLGVDRPVPRVTPGHPVVDALVSSVRGLRIGRTGAVVEALIPAVCEQKITSAEAHRVWNAIVARFGESAPGPWDLTVPPAPETLAAQPYWAFHRLGLERKRTQVVRAVCTNARRLEETAGLGLTDAYRRLRAIQGIGVWTAAEVGLRAFGDLDAVSVGDYHLPHLVTSALANEPRGTDERMLELLEPYRGHRAWVVRLIEIGVPRRARRAPRAPIRRFAAI